jgi:hypothetical protein
MGCSGVGGWLPFVVLLRRRLRGHGAPWAGGTRASAASGGTSSARLQASAGDLAQGLVALDAARLGGLGLDGWRRPAEGARGLGGGAVGRAGQAETPGGLSGREGHRPGGLFEPAVMDGRRLGAQASRIAQHRMPQARGQASSERALGGRDRVPAHGMPGREAGLVRERSCAGRMDRDGSCRGDAVCAGGDAVGRQDGCEGKAASAHRRTSGLWGPTCPLRVPTWADWAGRIEAAATMAPPEACGAGRVRVVVRRGVGWPFVVRGLRVKAWWWARRHVRRWGSRCCSARPRSGGCWPVSGFWSWTACQPPPSDLETAAQAFLLMKALGMAGSWAWVVRPV